MAAIRRSIAQTENHPPSRVRQPRGTALARQPPQEPERRIMGEPGSTEDISRVESVAKWVECKHCPPGRFEERPTVKETDQMRKLLATAALAAALISPTPAASQGDDVDSLDYLKVASALHVIVLCIMPATDAANVQDQKYLSDALFVMGFMQHGMNKERIKQAEGEVGDLVKRMGVEAFCRDQKPNLDKVVESARKQYSDELNRSFQDLPRILRGSRPAPEQSAAAPAPEQSAPTAPEQSTATPAPEQPRGWIAEVKESRPICASADDYVQFHRTSFDIARRPSNEAMQKAIEFVKRQCP